MELISLGAALVSITAALLALVAYRSTIEVARYTGGVAPKPADPVERIPTGVYPVDKKEE